MNSSIKEYPAIFYENGFFILEDNNESIYIEREEEFNIRVCLHKNIKKNMMIIGNPGTGKTTLIKEFARKNNHEIYFLETHKLIADTKYRGDFEERITGLLDMAEEYKMTIFIDEIHTLMNLGKSEGGIASNDILKSYLLNGKIIFIGATTTKEAESFLNDDAFNRRFSIINLKELDFPVLKNIYYSFMKKYEPNQEYIDEKKLNEIYNELESKITHRFFPDKWIDFFDYYYALNKLLHCSIDEGMRLYINDNKK